VCYRVNFTVKKGGQKTIKFSEGRNDEMQLRSAVGGLAVSIGPGLPKESRTTSTFPSFKFVQRTVVWLCVENCKVLYTRTLK